MTQQALASQHDLVLHDRGCCEKLCMPRRVAMAGLRCPHQRHGCRGVAYDVAVTSRAEIIRHAMRLVGSLSQSHVQSFLTLLGIRPPVPFLGLIQKVYKWAQRFLEKGIEGLVDKTGRGYHRVPRELPFAGQHDACA